MKFGRLDKRKGSGGPALTSRYAYLIHVADVAYFPEPDEKGVRLQGDVILHDDRQMMPIYLTNSSQEFSYETIGEDDEKTFKVEFQGTHPGTELEAMEFAKNFIEEPFIVLIPGCKPSEPWKLLGELTNPLIFVSNHKGNREGAKFNFTFEQAIGSEFIYFSYGGTVTPPDDPGTVDPPVNPGSGFDPTKWARIDASNIDPHIAAWRAKLGITPNTFHTGDITTTANNVRLNLAPDGQNWAEISGTRYTRTVEQNFAYVSVSAGKLKALILYALPTSQVFYMSEGVEGTEALWPTMPAGALIIMEIIAREGAQIVNPGEQDKINKYRSDDRWVEAYLNSSTPEIVRTGQLTVGCYNITAAPHVTPRIGGISNRNVWDGRKLLFRNDTGKDLEFEMIDKPESTVPVYTFAQGLTIKPGEYALFVVRYGELLVIETGGGASFPEGGARGDVLEWDAEGAVWTDRLTNAEAEIDAEVVNRAAADLQEKNERIAADANLQTQVTPLVTSAPNWNTAYSWGNHATAGYASNADLTAGLANRVPLTTTNIAAPDSTYFYVYMMSAGNVPRRMNLDSYLNAKGYAVSTDVSNKLDKINTAAQSVASAITFNGRLSYKNVPAAVNIAGAVVLNNVDEMVRADAVEILADDGASVKYASEAALDAAYPAAVSGFELVCPNISTTNFPNGVIYKKTTVGWRAEKLYLVSNV